VEVDRVPAEHSFFAEVGQASVADAAAAESVIHRVAANAVRIGALDNHVARQIGDFGAEFTRAGMRIVQRSVERQCLAGDFQDLPAFRLRLPAAPK
jgi:hypothetical protein